MADMVGGSRSQSLSLDIAGQSLTVTHPDRVVFAAYEDRPPSPNST